MTRTILYVDDDAANRTVFKAAYGHEFPIVTAPGGHEALELLASQEFAVLLVDQRMPGMSGIELLARAREHFPDPVRILITAYSNLDEAVRAINLGHIRRYLRKPWNHDELRAAMLDAVDVYTMRRKLEALEQRMVQSERVYALGVVAASLAHEIRNPLMTLTANLEVAQLHVGGVAHDYGEDEFIRALRFKLDTAHRAATQIQEIIEGSTLGHRRHDEEQQADLYEVLRLTLVSLGGTLRQRARVELDIEVVPQVCGSRTQLGQIAFNLAVNALQALPEQSRASDHVLRFALSRQGDMVRLGVEDDGPGIPPGILERIFDPFFTTRKAGGTGLGLAITKRIVEEVGGSISVDSRVGRGTCFEVLLPVAGD